MPRILLLSNPRSGSTYLGQLLDSHPECSLTHELLNEEEEINGNVLDHVENIISKFPETFVGFKVFPGQIFGRNLRFDSLVQHIGATHVIVLWRESILKNFVSFRIAEKTNIWYNNDMKDKSAEDVKHFQIHVNVNEVRGMLESQENEWEKIGEQWPGGVQPIFVKFEDFVSDADKWVRYIFSRLSCDIPKDFHFRSESTRQNPGKFSDKISNWSEIPPEILNLKINVPDLLLRKIKSVLSLPSGVSSLAPDREPCMPSGGWRYRVADPFMPTQLKQNVFDAISSGSISSAGFYPRLMATKLKALFGVPVAQPCSNGFTALLLALQAANIGKEDEVILPSMTMVAVANAVAFLGARPVFVDCSEDNYNPGWFEIENTITEKTKAVIVTHTYGVPTPDMEKITEECISRGLWLIEDISECVGVKITISDGSQKLLGTFGHFAGASMYVNKMIHAGDGGFVIAKDSKFAPRLTSLVNHGFTPSYHFVHFEVAANAKINGLGAAMACGCIEEIEKVMEHRNMVADVYRTLLRSLPLKLMPVCGPQDTPWVFGVECTSKEQRTQLRAFLAESGIETRDFFFPLHLQPAFENLLKEMPEKKMTNCEKFGSRGFYLPTHSNLEMKDLYYISSVVSAFFTEDKEISVKLVHPAPLKKQKLAVQIKPDSFKVEVRKFDSSGGLDVNGCVNGHLYIDAVRLSLDAEEYLIFEKWDSVNLFISRVKLLIEEARQEDIPFVQEYFMPYLKYFESQAKLEQSDFDRPWLTVDLRSKTTFPAAKIPTTTDEETLQLLVWLVREMKPETIWEIGSWFGHATFLMAAAGEEANCQRQRIFACDAFMWQNWMARFVNMEKIIEGSSFKNIFLKNTKKYEDIIQIVDWPYDIQELPEMLRNQKPNLIFLDITQEDEDLEELWRMMEGNLIENETIIVFNGITLSSIPFFTRHADELIPVAKPYTIAKVFRYVKKESKVVEEPDEDFTPGLLPRKFNFSASPNWDHHHNNLFGRTVDLLRQKFHADDAETIFVAAVEETMCDHPEIFVSNPWVGIIHSVPVYREIFYAPDLERLCSPNYAKLMKQCRGLFTLTKFQAKYLSDNLPKEFSFPIQSLLYPMHEIESPKASLVPELWKETKILDLILIGSFARDYDMFFNVKIPQNFRKVILAGDFMGENAAKRAPSDVSTIDRLSPDEYEETISKSVIFLSLKYDGAANTLILECIARNLPIVAPNLECCKEYLGSEYPLLYNQENPNLLEILTLENITNAINYLKDMDKSRFHPNKIVESIENGAVMLSLPPYLKPSENSTNALNTNRMSFSKFDVTISICSYKRTHHLKAILDSLWRKQDFPGTMQIIVWNNNDCRSATVRDICSTYIQKSCPEKSLEIINSTTNYYCSIRFAMPHLMKSDYLLICDDDIIPNENYVSFFMSARNKYPNDVLCLRGHKFLEHQLNVENPTEVWNLYENLKFLNDDDPEDLIHFVHADACLIPKTCLEEIASVKMPDLSFALVDDYWMSFLLNHQFNRKLRKLNTQDTDNAPMERTSDSDTIGLALHTRPEVYDARIRLYIHHMLKGWPSWPSQMETIPSQSDLEEIKTKKREIWNKSFIGYNISSTIDEKGVDDLHKMGVSCVRIGAVGVGKQIDSELSGFLSFPDAVQEQLRNLDRTVELLSTRDISVVLTLHRKIASPKTWKIIAKHFANNKFLVGYDIINEPFTPTEKELCWSEVAETNDPDILATQQKFIELVNSIRSVDKVTPIIIEPTFWGHIEALDKLPMEELLKADPELIFSFHFYEPMFLTQRFKNKGRFTFPGDVPIYDNIDYSEIIHWNEELIQSKFQKTLTWAKKYGVKIFLGEFGITRDIPGAEKYLRCIMATCKNLNIIGFLFSFRDNDWEAMDYELGTSELDILVTPNWHEGLMKTVVDGIRGQI